MSRASSAEASPVTQHALPAEYRTPEGDLEDWAATLRYLGALERSGRPIVVAVSSGTAQAEGLATQQIGFLRHQGQHRLAPNLPAYESFDLYWPDREQLAGHVALYEHLFEGAILSTNDGDDYFSLSLRLGELRIVFLDSNVHLDRAHPKRERELDDLPTPADLEQEWEGYPSEWRRKVRSAISGLRQELVNHGAAAVKTMSDSEMMSTAVRARWKLRQHPAEGDDWVAALAAAIREGEHGPEGDRSPGTED
jgi:hypothetical protein